MESLIVTLVIGAIAGWLAARVLKSTAFGLIGDIIVGVIGGYVGTWLWVARMEPPGPAFGRPDDKLRVMRERRRLRLELSRISLRSIRATRVGSESSS